MRKLVKQLSSKIMHLITCFPNKAMPPLNWLANLWPIELETRSKWLRKCYGTRFRRGNYPGSHLGTFITRIDYQKLYRFTLQDTIAGAIPLPNRVATETLPRAFRRISSKRIYPLTWFLSTALQIVCTLWRRNAMIFPCCPASSLSERPTNQYNWMINFEHEQKI